MKKTHLLPVVALLSGLALVACGGKGGEAPADGSSKNPASSQKTSSKASTSKHEHTFDETKWESNETNHWHPATCEHTTQKGSSAAHTFVEDKTQSKAATCKEDGVKVEKCSVCNYVKTTTLPKGAHTWGNKSAVVGPEGKSKYYTQECTTCHTKDLVLDALSWTAKEGDNKDTTNATLKFSKNGNHADYEFDAPYAIENASVALYGWVDFWKDGTNNNDQRGHIVNGSATFSLKVNDVDCPVTNDKTFEEMGMTAGENGNGSFTLCPLGGTVSVAKGACKVVYTRVASYNLNITEIHFLG